MRIGISGIAVNNMTGLGRLSRTALLALAQEAPDDWELVVYLRGRSDFDYLSDEAGSSAALIDRLGWVESGGRWLKRHGMEEWDIPRRMGGLDLDAWLGCDFTLPARKIAKREFVFLPDMLPFKGGVGVNPLSAWWYRRGIKRSVTRAAHHLCISEFTKREFEKRYPKLNGGCSVVYPAISPRLLELADRAPSGDYGLQVQGSLRAMVDPGPFMLAVGMGGRRKNAQLTVQCFKQLVLSGAYKGSLVLTGGDGRFHTPDATPQFAFATLGEQEHDDARSPEVYDIGRVNDFDLSQLYRSAELLLCLSSEEGFGYPVAEALAHSTPALVTSESPMTEIADKGIAKTALDPDTVTHAMISAANCLGMLRREAQDVDSSRFSIDALGRRLVDIIAG